MYKASKYAVQNKAPTTFFYFFHTSSAVISHINDIVRNIEAPQTGRVQSKRFVRKNVCQQLQKLVTLVLEVSRLRDQEKIFKKLKSL